MKMFCSTGSEDCEIGSTECPVLSRLHHKGIGSPECSVLARFTHKDIGDNGLAFSGQGCWNRLRNSSCNGSEQFGNTEEYIMCNNNNDCGTDNHSSKGMKAICNGYTLQEASSFMDCNAEEASPRLNELLEGLNEPGDSRNPPVQPEWLDRELFDRGRKFYQKFLFCIFFSDLLSLLMAFSLSRILRPLIYTEKSDTPTRALRRYVSTILHIITWFSGDVWDPNDKAHKDILHVRNIHKKSADIFNSSENYDQVQGANVREKGHTEPKCPFSPSLRQDLQMQAKKGLCLESHDNPPLYISQWDMALTQYCFLGIILVYPNRMGAWRATEEDLEGFVHFWRGIGWLLGIEDKYNFCKGTAAETKALCKEVEKFVIIPSLSRSNWNNEHMSSSLMDGINMMVPGLSYPAMFRFLADTLGLSVPLFVRNMSLKHTVQYWVMRAFLHFAFLIPGLVYFFNSLLKMSLGRVQEKHPGWFPESRKVIFTNT
ncbi:uncharacterized protein LOC135204809 [Macrobrachium nipponense]|uniref:uncharacterized protein LOC135204809 n=1 Tax=Macrobrachium nipponense TaxID=159736 RepID=UPI0030C82E61